VHIGRLDHATGRGWRELSLTPVEEKELENVTGDKKTLKVKGVGVGIWEERWREVGEREREKWQIS